MKTIKQLREASGMTQYELAVRLSVTPTTISAWERGQYEPRASQLRKLAETFAEKMDDIDTESPVSEGKDAA
ncbi:MAG: helix-turn-helix transcriptional regulator [Chloroflexota bacterium]|nr:helix-turn-helix transcriptional regulator [Chloroflexota bacterium]